MGKIKKLRSLSYNEILFRIKDKLIVEKEKLLHSFNVPVKYVNRPLSKQNGPPCFFLDRMDHGQTCGWLEKIGADEEIVQEAEAIMNSTINLLGHEMKIPKDAGWQKDPETGRQWPGLFYSKVRMHETVRDLDIKFVWEINRHQYLIPVAKAFWVKRDETYAHFVIKTIINWIESNPYHTGVNWNSPLEHAVRLFSWTWALQFCKKSQNYEKHIEKIRRSVYEQAFHISKHLSIYSSPYNHLIGEAAALFLVGVMYPEFGESKKWMKKGFSILEGEVEKQFHPDGMTVEQACYYHHFTLGFYTSCVLLGRLNDIKFSDNMMNRLEKAFEISLFLSMPDGTLPQKGDIDNARSIYFSSGHSWDFSFFQAIGTVLFNNGLFKNKEELSEELIWLLLNDEIEKYLSIRPGIDSKKTSRVFEKSGYGIMRSSWASDAHYFCFDCGEIADGLSQEKIPSSAHGHADALSIEMCAYGVPMLVDSGFFTYFGDEEWHRYFRQESAHNTFMIDGYKQAEYCGRLKWQGVKPVRLLSWDENDENVLTSASIEFEDGLTATRKILYQKQSFWVIKDIVSTRKSFHRIRSFFNFHPGVTLTVNEDNSLFVQNKHAGIMIFFTDPVNLDSQKNENDGLHGWVCKGYGFKQKAPHIKIEWQVDEKRNSTTFFIVPFMVNREKPVMQTTGKRGEYILKIAGDSTHVDLNKLMA